MIDVAAWFLAYMMIAAGAYLRTRSVLIAGTVPLLAHLLLSGIAVVVT